MISGDVDKWLTLFVRVRFRASVSRAAHFRTPLMVPISLATSRLVLALPIPHTLRVNRRQYGAALNRWLSPQGSRANSTLLNGPASSNRTYTQVGGSTPYARTQRAVRARPVQAPRRDRPHAQSGNRMRAALVRFDRSDRRYSPTTCEPLCGHGGHATAHFG